MVTLPRYRHEGRVSIIPALEAMIDALDESLRVIVTVADEINTVEAYREMDEEVGIFISEDDLRRDVENGQDQSMVEIGHVQRRIAEVQSLKAAFESEVLPSSEVLTKTYVALMDSINYEAIRVYGLTTGDNTSDWNAKRLAEDKKEEYRIHLYSYALIAAFGVMPFMRWHRFPFDTP
jgi:hypothetical protein